MPIPNRPLSQNKYSEQNMGNTSFDEDFGVNAVENLVYNPTTETLDRMTQASLFTHVTTAVTLTTAGTTYLLPTTEQSGRKTLVIYNVSDTAVYIGTASVTTTTGILLSPGEKIAIDAESGIYGVCGTSSKIVNVLEAK